MTSALLTDRAVSFDMSHPIGIFFLVQSFHHKWQLITHNLQKQGKLVDNDEVFFQLLFRRKIQQESLTNLHYPHS